MSCYIVVFEVASPATRERVKQILMGYGSYCPVTEHSWAILTDEKPTEIRDKIVPVMQSTDRLFVLRSGTAAAWRNSYGPNYDDWLKQNL